MSRVFKNDRPELLIKRAGVKKIANSCHDHYFIVTSLQPLDKKQLDALYQVNMLGHGQGCWYQQVNADGTKSNVPEKLQWDTRRNVVPSGYDVVQCAEINPETGEVVKCPSINPYTKTFDEPIKVPYFVYEVTNRVDTSD